MASNCLSEDNMLTFAMCSQSTACVSHYANSTIIYVGVLMGLTQVMLQVKGCEMVCKQRELIPRLRQIVTPEQLPSPLLCLPPPLPLVQPVRVSDSTLQGLSRAIKKVPKHGRKCHRLAKKRLQDQYKFQFW